MPNMDNGRQKILDYLKENNLTMATLAVQYSMTRQEHFKRKTEKSSSTSICRPSD